MVDHRILNRDPTYERIQAQRAARSSALFASMAFWCGLGACGGAFALGAQALLVPAAGFGVAWLFFKVRSAYYRKTYVE